MAEYTFAEVEKKHLGLLEEWLKAPEVAKWYTDPDYIEDIEDGLSDERIRMRIVSYKGSPFAFIQDYHIHGWRNHHLSFLPKGSRGLDTFIGKTEMIGLGHGSKYLSIAVKSLQRKVPALGIDPSPDNLRAIAAYKKVGFVEREVAETDYGKVLLMSLDQLNMFELFN